MSVTSKCLKIEYHLWQIDNLEKDINKTTLEREEEEGNLQELAQELKKYKHQKCAKEKELAEYQEKIDKLDRKIMELNTILKKNNRLRLKVMENIPCIKSEIQSTKVELDKKTEEKERHSGKVEKLEKDVSVLTQKLKEMNENVPDAGSKFQLAEGDLQEYCRVKEEAGCKTVKVEDGKEILDRQQKSDVEAQKNLEENLQPLEELNLQEQEMKQRSERDQEASKKHEEEMKQLTKEREELRSKSRELKLEYKQSHDLGAHVAQIQSTLSTLESDLKESHEKEAAAKLKMESITDDINHMEEKLQEWKSKLETCVRGKLEIMKKISSGKTSSDKLSLRIHSKRLHIENLAAKRQEILKKCLLIRTSLPTGSDPMEFDSLQKDMRPSEHEKQKADLLEALARYKFLDQYKPLRQKKDPVSKEIDTARKEEKETANRDNAVRDKRELQFTAWTLIITLWSFVSDYSHFGFEVLDSLRKELSFWKVGLIILAILVVSILVFWSIWRKVWGYMTQHQDPVRPVNFLTVLLWGIWRKVCF